MEKVVAHKSEKEWGWKKTGTWTKQKNTEWGERGRKWEYFIVVICFKLNDAYSNNNKTPNHRSIEASQNSRTNGNPRQTLCHVTSSLYQLKLWWMEKRIASQSRPCMRACVRVRERTHICNSYVWTKCVEYLCAPYRTTSYKTRTISTKWDVYKYGEMFVVHVYSSTYSSSALSLCHSHK